MKATTAMKINNLEGALHSLYEKAKISHAQMLKDSASIKNDGFNGNSRLAADYDIMQMKLGAMASELLKMEHQLNRLIIQRESIQA